jgi:hypothetical protein
MEAICNNGTCLVERLKQSAALCQGQAREASKELGDNGKSDAMRSKLQRAIDINQAQATMFTAGAENLQSRKPPVCTGKGRCGATVYMSEQTSI